MREVRGEQKAARKAPRQLRPSRLRRRGYANGGRRRGRRTRPPRCGGPRWRLQGRQPERTGAVRGAGGNVRE